MPAVYEWIGYLASILVAASLMMSSILRLRIINLAGAVCFTVYGLAIRAYPVAAVNFLIVLIDLYYLYGMLKAREFFTLMEVKPGSEYLAYFLSYYDREIQKFLPGFRYEPGPGQVTFFILRNMVPAGLFIGVMRPPDCLAVELDFVIPGYRDLKTGRYVFEQQAGFFRSRGIRQVTSPPGSPAHQAYLERMGFVRQAGSEGAEAYCMVIK